MTKPLTKEQLELLRYLPSVGGGIGFNPNPEEYRTLRRELTGFHLNDRNRFWRTYQGDTLLATLAANNKSTAERLREIVAAMKPGPCNRTAECEGCLAEWMIVLDDIETLAQELDPEGNDA